MRARKKLLLISIIGSFSLLCIGVGTFSLSKFFIAKPISQTIGYSGGAKQSIYLDLNEWHAEDGRYSTTSHYYMYAYGSSGDTWVEPTTTDVTLENVTIGGTGSVSNRYLKVFLYDNVRYNTGFTFVRVKAEASGPSWGDKLHQTKGITYSTYKHNYYCITGLSDDDEMNEARSSYSSKMVYEGQSGLTFNAPA